MQHLRVLVHASISDELFTLLPVSLSLSSVHQLARLPNAHSGGITPEGAVRKSIHYMDSLVHRSHPFSTVRVRVSKNTLSQRLFKNA